MYTGLFTFFVQSQYISLFQSNGPMSKKIAFFTNFSPKNLAERLILPIACHIYLESYDTHL